KKLAGLKANRHTIASFSKESKDVSERAREKFKSAMPRIEENIGHITQIFNMLEKLPEKLTPPEFSKEERKKVVEEIKAILMKIPPKVIEEEAYIISEKQSHLEPDSQRWVKLAEEWMNQDEIVNNYSNSLVQKLEDLKEEKETERPSGPSAEDRA